ncbi:MAG: HAD-IA family hydrolase [Chthoniobacterales bacterium]|nr:HAD-IA family hydrolase [Chthoniobacterales bacterium]
MHLHFQAWSRAMNDFGGTYPEELFYQWGGVPTAEIVRRLNAKFGIALDVDRVVDRKEHYYREMIPGVQARQDVVAIAREHHGRIPLAVASGGHRDLVDRTLRALGIDELFSAVIAAEDYNRGKPHPDPFLVAARVVGVEPEHCLVFEDTATGAQAAKAAGMACVLV